MAEAGCGVKQSFTQDEFDAAVKQWGCNCGPSALAFALQTKLDVARDLIPKFDEKRYTSPTMMKAALLGIGCRFTPAEVSIAAMFAPGGQASLVRVQWTGPWTEPGSNPKWAYGYTHWICTWVERGAQLVFDCNGGMQSFHEWRDETVPLLIGGNKRATGWVPTHIWRLPAFAGGAMVVRHPYARTSSPAAVTFGKGSFR